MSKQIRNISISKIITIIVAITIAAIGICAGIARIAHADTAHLLKAQHTHAAPVSLHVAPTAVPSLDGQFVTFHAHAHAKSDLS